ncbi:MAG: PTS sugar transporter subunit IIA [Chloroflexi bacterium]|nr:PTS sugar transporter subunit IIA [Chloroflexota bacterium]
MQEREVEGSALSKTLTEETIALGLSVRDWQEAVHEAGKLLVKAGMVEPRYIEAMVQMVKDIGPYIVIAPGVALPHARPEDGVKKACMSLVTLSPPVNFGNEHNDPVKLVVAFGTTDNKAHIEALTELARLLGDSTKLEGLARASSPEEILKLIGSIQESN